MGTLVAWVLVRDQFPGKRFVNALIDLPFALPTIVAGLTLIALYGPDSPFGVHLAYTRAAVIVALLFVTLPFVVRSVQPVLIELDKEVEEAAASLGASNATTFRRIILPALRPAIFSGAALAFARSVGEFGSLVLIVGQGPDRQHRDLRRHRERRPAGGGGAVGGADGDLAGRPVRHPPDRGPGCALAAEPQLSLRAVGAALPRGCCCCCRSASCSGGPSSTASAAPGHG